MVGVVALAVRTGRGRVVLGYVPRRVIWRAMRRGLGGSRGFYRKKGRGKRSPERALWMGWILPCFAFLLYDRIIAFLD